LNDGLIGFLINIADKFTELADRIYLPAADLRSECARRAEGFQYPVCWPGIAKYTDFPQFLANKMFARVTQQAQHVRFTSSIAALRR